MGNLDTIEIFRLPKSITYDKNIVEVYIPPPKTPENWPPEEKPDPPSTPEQSRKAPPI